MEAYMFEDLKCRGIIFIRAAIGGGEPLITSGNRNAVRVFSDTSRREHLARRNVPVIL